MQSNLTIANDNMPLGDNVPLGYNMPIGYDMPVGYSRPIERTVVRGSGRATSVISVSDYSPVKSGVKLDFPQVPAPIIATTKAAPKKIKPQKIKPQKIKQRKAGRFPVYALLILWALAVAAIARFAGSPNDSTLVGTNLAIAGGGLGLLSLWLASLARRRNAKISHSIGIAGACMSLAGLLWFYLQQSSIPISAEFLTLGIAGTSLIFARIWHTPFLLHVSLLVMIGWSAYSFLNSQVSELAWLFPALWSVQMFLALEFRIKRSISLCVFTGLLWIAVNWVLLS